jgi:hypothetical protein
MISTHRYRTLRAAASFFADARAQGFSPSLLVDGDGWKVEVYAIA